MRRKQAYEALHPETRHGGDRKSSRNPCDLNDRPRFTADTASPNGQSERAAMIGERVAIAEAVRDDMGERRGRPSEEKVQDIAQIEAGTKTRDIAARKAGFGNAETYRQAKSVLATGAPD